jgi:hypothetical protein
MIRDYSASWRQLPVTSYQLPAIMVNVGQTSLHKKPAAQAIGLVNKEQVRAGQL